MDTIAVYNGEKFKAGDLGDGRISLITRDKSYLAKGFREKQRLTGKGIEYYYVKIVTKEEVTEFYSEYERYYWKGYELNCRSKSETAYELTGLPGHDYKIAERLGMRIVDKYEYGKWVDKSEVTVKKERENELTGEITVLDS